MGTKNYNFHYIDEPKHRRRELVPETTRFLNEIDEALFKIATEKGVSKIETEVKGDTVTIIGKDSTGVTITESTFIIEGGGTYTLPTATAERLGGIKVGNNLTVTEDGTLSATGGGSYTLPTATAERLGGIKVGDNLTVTEDGTLSATGGDSYTLPPATKTDLGGVIVGDGLDVEESGKISVVAEEIVNNISPRVVDNPPTNSEDIGFAAGYGAYARGSAVAIGKNTKTHAAAVALGEEANAEAWGSVAIGREANSSGDRSVAVGVEAYSAEGGVAIGNACENSGDYEKCVVIGNSMKAGGANSVTIGNNGHKGAADSVIICAGSLAKDYSAAGQSVVMTTNTPSGEAKVNGVRSVAMGCAGYDYPFTSNGTNSVTIGYGAQSLGESGQTVIGDRAKAESMATSAVSIGQEATANATESVAVGYQTIAEGTRSVAIGSGSYAGGAMEFAVGNSGGERKIVHVLTPTSSTDAATKGYVDGLAPALHVLTVPDELSDLKLHPLPVWGNGSLRNAMWILSNSGASNLTISADLEFANDSNTLKGGQTASVVTLAGDENILKVDSNGHALTFANDFKIEAGKSVYLMIGDEEF